MGEVLEVSIVLAVFLSPPLTHRRQLEVLPPRPNLPLDTRRVLSSRACLLVAVRVGARAEILGARAEILVAIAACASALRSPASLRLGAIAAMFGSGGFFRDQLLGLGPPPLHVFAAHSPPTILGT